MAFRSGLGPVFAYDCLTTARRWQVYAGRGLLVASLLTGLSLTWLTRYSGPQFQTYQQLAVVGGGFYTALMSVELVLALVLVPAATAGAICQDKMRGGLALAMVTDLSDTELVLGKLASRLAAVLGVLLCGVPVLALSTFLGGVDPVETLAASLVIVGVAVLGTCLALTYSVWATKPHEALMATYATWAVWLLTLLAWGETIAGPAPAALHASNPFWLVIGRRWFGPSLEPPLPLSLAFLAGTLAVSAALAGVAVRRIRGVTLQHAGRTAARARRRPGLGDRWISLDRHPVLWREWHRRQPSGWGRAIWRLYSAVSVFFVLVCLVRNHGIACGTAGFMVSIGLLMVSVTAATALAEERAHGSLDVLLTTPLSTREIVLGKWWGGYRTVIGLAVLPGLLALGLVWSEQGIGEALVTGLLTAGLVLAYGAAVASLGLAAAAWQPRLGRAVAVSVCVYLSVTVLYPTVAIMVGTPPPDDFWLAPSPFFGPYIVLTRVVWPFNRRVWPLHADLAVVNVLVGAVAFGLYHWTLASFDRLTGRVPEQTSAPEGTARRRSARGVDDRPRETRTGSRAV